MVKKIYLPIINIIFFFVTGLLPDSITAQSIISLEKLEEISKAELTLQSGFPALNGVIVYKVDYLTTGSNSEPDTASGLVVLPDDTTVIRLVAYQHGTSGSREDVPSRNNFEAVLVKAFAGQGYVAIAADYIGLGDSRGFHPYVHAATEASAGVDLLLAAKDLASDEGFGAMEQIFVTGYSQGGHAAMAMAQAMQERDTDDLFITAAAPMSGPYNISGVMRNVILQDSAEYFFPSYVAYTLLGYQEVYGNLYDSLSEIFRPQFVSMIESFSAGNIDLSTLNQFLINQLTTDFGSSVPGKLFNEQFLVSFTNDSLLPISIALRDNDTYLWVPQFPMRLYYCTADDQVNFMNSLVAAEYMNAQGAADVQAIDVLPTGDHGECVLPAVLSTLGFFNEFQVSTSIAEKASWEVINVFPNPADQQLNIAQIPGTDLKKIQIFNQLGFLVFEQQLMEMSGIPVSQLPSGIYHLSVTGSREQWRSNFIVQH